MAEYVDDFKLLLDEFEAEAEQEVAAESRRLENADLTTRLLAAIDRRGTFVVSDRSWMRLECGPIRNIVELHTPTYPTGLRPDDPRRTIKECPTCADAFPCPTIQHIAELIKVETK